MTESHRTDFDAIVVGAGFAGVTAARELRAEAVTSATASIETQGRELS